MTSRWPTAENGLAHTPAVLRHYLVSKRNPGPARFVQVAVCATLSPKRQDVGSRLQPGTQGFGPGSTLPARRSPTCRFPATPLARPAPPQTLHPAPNTLTIKTLRPSGPIDLAPAIHLPCDPACRVRPPVQRTSQSQVATCPVTHSSFGESKGGGTCTITLVSETTYDRTVNAIGPFERSEYLGLALVCGALAATAPVRAQGDAGGGIAESLQPRAGRRWMKCRIPSTITARRQRRA